MANYVYQKVVCSKEFLERYLIDEYPLGSDKKISPPYISFNKLFGMTDIADYGKNLESIFITVVDFPMLLVKIAGLK